MHYSPQGRIPLVLSKTNEQHTLSSRVSLSVCLSVYVWMQCSGHMLINTKQREHFSRGLLGSLQVAPPFLHSQQFLLANAYFLSELGSCEQPPADNSAATPHHSQKHWHQPRLQRQIRIRKCKHRCMTEAVPLLKGFHCSTLKI